MDFRRALRDVKLAGIAAKTTALSAIDRDRGKKYLVESLSSIPGLPTKIAQILGMKLGQVPQEAEPMSLKEVETVIEQESTGLHSMIREFSTQARVASLGQVHRVTLQDGRKLALKVQYPGVQKEFLRHLKLALKLFDQGPAKKFGFKSEEYDRFLSDQFLGELDYRAELEKQKIFGTLWSEGTFVVVPKVYEELSSSHLLAQDWEDSESLEQVSKQTEEIRRDAAYLVAMYFVTSVFGVGFIHGDFHPKNYGFRRQKLVLYDFGSMLRIKQEHAVALKDLIQSIQEERADNQSVFDHLVYLGFEAEKIEKIYDRLLEVAQLVFEPFVSRYKFDANAWNLSERLDNILGGDKWWFRMAGPPWVLSLMKVFQGHLHALKKLDTSVAMSEMFRMVSQSYPRLSQSVEVPKVKSQFAQNQTQEFGAKYLNVCIKENNSEVVRLEMPVASVDDLENLVSPETREKIEKNGTDLVKIRETVKQSGYQAQELFEEEVGSRKYRVWLS